MNAVQVFVEISADTDIDKRTIGRNINLECFYVSFQLYAHQCELHTNQSYLAIPADNIVEFIRFWIQTQTLQNATKVKNPILCIKSGIRNRKNRSTT